MGRILPTADMLLQAMILYGIRDFNAFLGIQDQEKENAKTELTQEQSEMLDLMEQSNEQGKNAARAVLMTFKR